VPWRAWLVCSTLPAARRRFKPALFERYCCGTQIRCAQCLSYAERAGMVRAQARFKSLRFQHTRTLPRSERVPSFVSAVRAAIEGAVGGQELLNRAVARSFDVAADLLVRHSRSSREEASWTKSFETCAG
jgi:hypothetical protein